jgi:hypothetical protein
MTRSCSLPAMAAEDERSVLISDTCRVRGGGRLGLLTATATVTAKNP